MKLNQANQIINAVAGLPGATGELIAFSSKRMSGKPTKNRKRPALAPAETDAPSLLEKLATVCCDNLTVANQLHRAMLLAGFNGPETEFYFLHLDRYFYQIHQSAMREMTAFERDSLAVALDGLKVETQAWVKALVERQEMDRAQGRECDRWNQLIEKANSHGRIVDEIRAVVSGNR